ncbi:MAG: hypothetical protein AAFQ14_07265 [Cyanobacteria bacterium J06621_12]
MKLIGNILTVLLLGWFGMTCFKLGWYAQDNPFLRPIASTVFGLKEKEQEPAILDRLQEMFD